MSCKSCSERRKSVPLLDYIKKMRENPEVLDSGCPKREWCSFRECVEEKSGLSSTPLDDYLEEINALKKRIEALEADVGQTVSFEGLCFLSSPFVPSYTSSRNEENNSITGVVLNGIGACVTTPCAGTLKKVLTSGITSNTRVYIYSGNTLLKSGVVYNGLLELEFDRSMSRGASIRAVLTIDGADYSARKMEALELAYAKELAEYKLFKQTGVWKGPDLEVPSELVLNPPDPEPLYLPTDTLQMTRSATTFGAFSVWYLADEVMESRRESQEEEEEEGGSLK